MNTIASIEVPPTALEFAQELAKRFGRDGDNPFINYRSMQVKQLLLDALIECEGDSHFAELLQAYKSADSLSTPVHMPDNVEDLFDDAANDMTCAVEAIVEQFEADVRAVV